MKKVVFNTRLLTDKNKLEGIGWYTFEILKRITRNQPAVQFFFLFDRQPSAAFLFSDNITPIVIKPPTRHPILQHIWFQWQVPRFLRKVKPDIFISTEGYIPLHLSIPVINVIHDINFYHSPKNLKPADRIYMNYFFPKFAKKADHIFTVSDYSRKDIIRSFKVPEEKVTYVYNGINEIYAPIKTNDQKKVKEYYTGGRDFFIFVGALHPRKNVGTLLEAFDLLRENHSVDMIIVGEKMHKTKSLFNTYQRLKHKEYVHFIGRKNPEELRILYGASLALTFIPYFEGFGIPLAEAMKCGTAIIASNTTCLPEVVNGAGLLTDPDNKNEIVQAMQSIIENRNLRQKLITEGSKRQEAFNWDNTANQLWDKIDQLT